MKSDRSAVVFNMIAFPGLASADLGPSTHDASGVTPGSVRRPSYDKARGWPVLRGDDGSAQIWISNIAVMDQAAYRVLNFSQAAFKTCDDVRPVRWKRRRHVGD